MSVPVHYYVWYRVAGEPGAARVAVEAVLADVARSAGVAGRLRVRRDDPRTWMEIYEDVGDADRFEDVLTAAVARHGLAQWLEGGARHAEPFIAPG